MEELIEFYNLQGALGVLSIILAQACFMGIPVVVLHLRSTNKIRTAQQQARIEAQNENNRLEAVMRKHYDDLVTDMRDRLSRQEAQIDALRNEMHNKDIRLAEAETRADERDKRVSELLKRLDTSREENTGLRATIATLEERLSSLASENEGSKARNLELENQNKRLAAEIASLTTQVTSLTDEVEKLRASYEANKLELDKLKQEKTTHAKLANAASHPGTADVHHADRNTGPGNGNPRTDDDAAGG